ncbi:MAG: signal peptide peptidase SppA [Desulfovibrio sp.]|jgi:protease-4|nr:signal peptide peptidase SppA [Desulfovibrio sp.]
MNPPLSLSPETPSWPPLPDATGKGGKTAASDRAASAQPPGEAWLRVPLGPEPKKPWRKRHPFLFFLFLMVLLGAVFSAGVIIGDGKALKPSIAVINLEGLILDSGAITRFIAKILADPNVKGAVLRINSPGGAVGPSQEIFASVKRLAHVKPLAASMGAVAASGGYYAALGAKKIFANPSTLTGSIGVKMQIPNLGGLLSTIGVSEKTLTTGKLKDTGNITREMRPEEEEYLRALLKDMYDEFVDSVSRERSLPKDRVLETADGRALTGRRALELGLVDEMGDINDALRYVQTQCGLLDGEFKIVYGPKKKTSLLAEFADALLETVVSRSREAEQVQFMY